MPETYWCLVKDGTGTIGCYISVLQIRTTASPNQMVSWVMTICTRIPLVIWPFATIQWQWDVRLPGEWIWHIPKSIGIWQENRVRWCVSLLSMMLCKTWCLNICGNEQHDRANLWKGLHWEWKCENRLPIGEETSLCSFYCQEYDWKILQVGVQVCLHQMKSSSQSESDPVVGECSTTGACSATGVLECSHPWLTWHNAT